jgi:hypothetical protein
MDIEVVVFLIVVGFVFEYFAELCIAVLLFLCRGVIAVMGGFDVFAVA